MLVKYNALVSVKIRDIKKIIIIKINERSESDIYLMFVDFKNVTLQIRKHFYSGVTQFLGHTYIMIYNNVL